jgi:4-carboxymuconolactone decarboxylase
VNGQPTPRIGPLPFEQWDPKTRDVYSAAMKTPVLGELSNKPLLNVLATLANNGWLFTIAIPFQSAISAGQIPARERELATLRTAYQTRSTYEWSQHYTLAQKAGVTETEIQHVAQGPDAPGWSAIDAALLQAVDQINANANIDEPTWQTLATRYDRNQLLELMYLVGSFRMLATLLNACQVPLEDWQPVQPFPGAA